jgi:hypothetical protein
VRANTVNLITLLCKIRNTEYGIRNTGFMFRQDVGTSQTFSSEWGNTPTFALANNFTNSSTALSLLSVVIYFEICTLVPRYR